MNPIESLDRPRFQSRSVNRVIDRRQATRKLRHILYGTGIPAAILIFKRHKVDRHVLFIDASRDYADVKTQNNLRVEDIAKIVGTYERRETVEKYADLATFEEIAENDFNLNIPRYVDTFEEEEEIDIMAVQTEIERRESSVSGLISNL